MAETGGKESRTPRDILRVVFRRKWLFALSASVIALLVLIGAHWYPLKYTGTTTFMLRSDSAAGSARSRGNESLEQIKLTLRHDLLDRNALETVITELGLDQGLARNQSNVELTREGQQAKQKLVESIGKGAELDWEVKSSNVDLLSLSFTHADPSIAAAIPNALVKNYIERTSEKITTRLTDSRNFLQKQVRNCETILADLEADRVKFETEHATVMPESPGAVQSRIDGLNDDRTRLSRERIKAQDKIDGIKRKIAQLNEVFPNALEHLKENWPQNAGDDPNVIKGLDLPGAAISASQPASQPAGTDVAMGTSQPTTKPTEKLVQTTKIPNPELKRLEDMLRTAKDDLYTMQSVRRMKDAHPQVQALKERIAKLEKDIENTPAKVVVEEVYDVRPDGTNQGPTAKPAPDSLGMYAMSEAMAEYRMATKEWEILQGESAEIEKKYNNLVSLMSNFHVVLKRYEEIRKKVAEQQTELNKWNARLREIQMDLSGEAANRRTHMTTVQAAQVRFLPSSPKLTFILGAAFAGAMAAGAALVFMMNFFDRTISTTDKALEFFDLPIHGVIGEIVSRNQRRWRKFRSFVLTPTVTIVVLGCVGVAAMSIILKLQYPELFNDWREAPLAFIKEHGIRHAADLIAGVIGNL